METSYTISEALKLLSSTDYISQANEIKSDKIVLISFKITENLTEVPNDPILANHFNDKSVIISFESIIDEHDFIIIWKNVQHENFKILNVAEDYDGCVAGYCKRCLLETIENQEIKIPEYRKVYKIKDLRTKDDHTLLIKAVIEGQNHKLVDNLLKHEFDLDCEFEIKSENKTQKFIAIDKAWENYLNAASENIKNVNNQIILRLLNANSRYPDELDYDAASTEVQEFIDKCEELHEFVTLKDIKSIKDGIQAVPQLCHIYDWYNESLMIHAMTLRHFDVIDYLSSIGVSIGSHEVSNLQEIYRNYEVRQLRMQRTKNQQIAKENPQIHILILQSKSKIGRNDRQHANHWKYINEAYKLLDQNESCRKVLKVVAACKNVQIFFDFKHTTTYYLDPVSSAGTLGITYGSGTINIGAKDLIYEDEKFKVIGVIAHEFCHFAVFMTFVNNFDPYPMGESMNKKEFVDEVFEECRINQEHEGMVGNVFRSYKDEHFHSELIVLVVQMMMHYCVKNCEKLTKNEEKFAKLFEYFKNFVEPELEIVLPVLKRLQDPNCDLKFKDLTEPMKAKILHTQIEFQGQKTTIFDILSVEIDKNCFKILNRLESSDLKRILMNKNVFNFGEIPKMTSKYFFIERPFINADNLFTNNYGWHREKEESKDYKIIIDEVKKSKIFILCGRAGDGKTTTLEFLTIKLKETFQNFWVSMIKLRNYKEILTANSNENLKINQIVDFFCKILNLKADFEEEIFKNLFFNNKVILLFDGLDEICPKFTEFFFKILKTLKNEAENQIWISSRFQHMKQLKELFEIKAFAIKPFEDSDRKVLQTAIANSYNIKIDNFHINFYMRQTSLNNPLLISIITKLYIHGKIDRNCEYYEIFEKMFEAHKDELDDKIDRIDRDPFEDFSHKKVHQVLALKFIFDNKDVQNLQIIKSWENEKENWTAEKIQRFGFVIVDLDFIKNNEKSLIDFIHKTIAEFLVTQFIIESIFDLKNEVNVQEIEIIFNLLKIIVDPNIEFEMRFFLSFMQNILPIKNMKINQEIKKLIIKEIQKVAEKCDSMNYQLTFWCIFLHNEQETLRMLWNEKQQKDLVKKFIFNVQNENSLVYLIDFLRGMLTESWDKILRNENSHSFRKISYYYTSGNYKVFSGHFENLLDFVDNNFLGTEQKIFCEKYLSISFLTKLTFDEYYKTSIFKKIYLLLLRNEMLNLSIFTFFMSNCHYYETLNLIIKLMEDLKVDGEFIRTILFEETFVKKIKQLISTGCLDCRSNQNMEKNEIKIGTFEFFTKYFQKYQISNEVQEIFISWKNIFKISGEFPENYRKIFIEKMKEIFHSNPLKIIDCIDMNSLYYDLNYYLIFENFLIHYFNENEFQVVKTMHKILFKAFQFFIPLEFINYSKQHDDFQKLLNLFTKYKTSQRKLIKIMKKWKVIPEIFNSISQKACQIFKEFLKINFRKNKNLINKSIKKHGFAESNIKELIKNEEKFNNFLDFWRDFFDGDEKRVEICIRNNLMSIHYFQCLEDAIYDEDLLLFERIKSIFIKYLSFKDLQNAILFEQPVFDIFSLANRKSFIKFDNFRAFLKQIFDNDRQKIMKFNSPIDMYWIMSNKVGFNAFEEFLFDFFEKDENWVRQFMRKQLLNSSRRGSNSFLNSPLFISNCGANFRIVYQKYTNHLEVQNLLILWKNLLKIFVNHNDFSTLEVRKFLLETFAGNELKIFDCIDFSQVKLFKDYKLCHLFKFEQFLLKLFNNDKSKIESCMRKILFKFFCKSFFFKNTKSLSKLEMLTDFYTKYKTSDKMLQIFLNKIDIFPDIFKHLSIDSYPKFKEFMLKSFHFNKIYLFKIYKTFQVIKTEDWYYEVNPYSRRHYRGISPDRDIKNFVKDFEESIYLN